MPTSQVGFEHQYLLIYKKGEEFPKPMIFFYMMGKNDDNVYDHGELGKFKFKESERE